jgi:hypothetical protein
MKPNKPHYWTITLHGKHEPGKKRIEQVDFIGTCDSVLARADEFECEVDFDVLQFVITRGKRATP